MADLQLALNHCLTTGAALLPLLLLTQISGSDQGFNSATGIRGVELISQSITHSPPPRLQGSHCQTKWFLVLLDAVCVHNLFTHGCGWEIYFFHKGYMWVSTCHYCSFAHCCFSHGAQAASPKLEIFVALSLQHVEFPTRCWHRVRSPVVLNGPARVPWGGLHCVIGTGTGQEKITAQKCTGVFSGVCFKMSQAISIESWHVLFSQYKFRETALCSIGLSVGVRRSNALSIITY